MFFVNFDNCDYIAFPCSIINTCTGCMSVAPLVHTNIQVTLNINRIAYELCSTRQFQKIAK